MATAPFLVVEDGERRLDVGVADGRRRLALSDRAETLLVDREYGNRDVVPWTVVRALVLAGGATAPGTGALELDGDLRGADGGASASDEDLRATAAYLESISVPDRTVEALREHVRSTGLSRFVDPGEIGSRADHVGDLSDLARDL